MKTIKTSSVILLAETGIPGKYVFGAYEDNGTAAGFLSLPEDHRRFVSILTGMQTVMGFKTLEATPADFPDAGRICITHHPGKVKAPAIAAGSVKEGIGMAKQRAAKAGQDVIYVIGGAEILTQCLQQELLDEIRLTLTEGYLKSAPNLVCLDFNSDAWEVLEDSGLLVSEGSDPPRLKYRYLRLGKVRRPA